MESIQTFGQPALFLTSKFGKIISGFYVFISKANDLSNLHLYIIFEVNFKGRVKYTLFSHETDSIRFELGTDHKLRRGYSTVPNCGTCTGIFFDKKIHPICSY